MSESFDKRGIPLPPQARDPLGAPQIGYDQREVAAGATEPMPPSQSAQPQDLPYYEQPGGQPDPRLGPSHGSGAPPTQTDTADPATFDTGRTQPPREFGTPLAAPAPVPTRHPPTAPIVPAASVTSRSLTLVIAIMCFFACLTAGAVYMMNKSASGWLRNLASEITVQIEPSANTDANKTVSEVIEFLQRQRGVVAATAIPVSTSRTLLEPWLGNTDALEELPIPRLIALQLDQNASLDFAILRANLSQQFPTATLDDHRQWQTQIKTVTRSFALGGLAILLLVGAATTAIIVSATRSAMMSNREIVEVLHFVGATDRFIAHEFEKNFLALGIRAGLVGALAAAVIFLAMPTVMELLGGGTMTLAEVKRLIGAGSLDALGFIWLGVVVVVVAALCMLTSRFGVYRILNNRDD